MFFFGAVTSAQNSVMNTRPVVRACFTIILEVKVSLSKLVFYSGVLVTAGMPCEATIYTVASNPASNAVTYIDQYVTLHSAFFYTVSGHLREIWWDGGDWNPAYDHGTPFNTSVWAIGVPSVASYLDPNNNYNLVLAVYVTGSDGHLYERLWKGYSWIWVDRGIPYSDPATSSPTAVAYVEADRSIRVHAFVMSRSGRLHCFVEDPDFGSWYDQGAPNDASLNTTEILSATSPSSASMEAVEFSEYPLFPGSDLYVFVRDIHGQLYANHWNGSGWTWESHGSPWQVSVASAPSSITLIGQEDAGNFISSTVAFVHGSNGHLFVNFQDYYGWHWSDLGTPTSNISVNTSTAPSVTGNYNSVNIFSVGWDGALYNSNWSLSAPNASNWYPEGPPSFCSGPCTLYVTPAAISFDDIAYPNPPGIQVFLLENMIYADFWTPSYWTWHAYAP
jgi:hypothetical protein